MSAPPSALGKRDRSALSFLGSIENIERATAALLTGLVVGFHFIAAASAGALWRDEANTVAVSTLPSVRDVWKNLQHESFPILWLLIVRGYASLVGPMNDPAFRALGFFIGLGVTAALWFNARTFRHSVPLLSLALLGMSPSMIRWGDTMRAYGFGIVLILLTCALLWRFIDRPQLGRFAASALLAIASVNVLYYNAVLLFAFCSGGIAVCIYRRRRRDAAVVVLIGALAAFSLVPYAATIRDTEAWSMLVRIPNYDFHWFWTKLGETLNPGGRESLLAWVALASAAAVYGTIAVIFSRWLNISEDQREIALFALVTLLVGTIGSFIFLRALSYYTRPWYYLTLLTVTAISVDILFGAVVQARALRFSRVVAALLLGTATLIPGSRLVRQRLTNVDIVAAKVDSIADHGDMIIVSPWQYGVTFSRYYHGTNAWVTVPPVAWHRFHRYDQLAALIRMADQNLPANQVTDPAGDALRSGHRVFVVGALEAQHGNWKPMISPQPTSSLSVWTESAHQQYWESMIGEFLAQHARTRMLVPLEVPQIVSRDEFAWLQIFEGWRP